jgi:hypothetical protein
MLNAFFSDHFHCDIYNRIICFSTLSLIIIDLTFSGLFVSLPIETGSTKRTITCTDSFALSQILHLQSKMLKGLVNN